MYGLKDFQPKFLLLKIQTFLNLNFPLHFLKYIIFLYKSVGLEKIENENSYDQKEKLLQEVIHQETVKSLKSSSQISNHPLSSVNGDKMSIFKYKLANIARFGGIGNDNSSDSGYEEVVQDGGNKLISMPPPADVMQSL